MHKILARADGNVASVIQLDESLCFAAPVVLQSVATVLASAAFAAPSSSSAIPSHKLSPNPPKSRMRNGTRLGRTSAPHRDRSHCGVGALDFCTLHLEGPFAASESGVCGATCIPRPPLFDR
ncbi:hypothetical protein C8R45DRAFT_1090276 [Mycena sanguinolenta]|nr:hypothetical protein C8R45DRAFT_1090276 [Mycena sanguinolenta]